MLVERIKNALGVLIVMHQRPDGDTFGSGFALYFLAKHFGVAADIVVDSDLPLNYSFLEDFDKINVRTVKKYDLCLVVDCGDADRMGKYKDYAKSISSINIDHHKSNEKFCMENIVVPEVSSTCEVIYDILKRDGVFGENYPSELRVQIAKSLLVGLSTDTGHFKHSTVNAKVMGMAKELIEQGANLYNTVNSLYRNDRKERLTLLAKILSKLEYFKDDKICVMTILKSDIEKAGAFPYDTEGFIDYALNLSKTLIAVSVTEGDKKEIKVSFRSKGIDVAVLAKEFGGGGHTRAAGATIKKGELEEVKKQVVGAALMMAF